jgi:hypothetical protein
VGAKNDLSGKPPKVLGKLQRLWMRLTQVIGKNALHRILKSFCRLPNKEQKYNDE